MMASRTVRLAIDSVRTALCGSRMQQGHPAATEQKASQYQDLMWGGWLGNLDSNQD